MTMSSIIGMARYLLRQGVVLTGAFAVLFAVGYFLIYKRIFKGKKRLRFRTAAVGMVFLCYLLVVCGATLGRGGGWHRELVAPFASYMDAWYDFSASAWRNLILNILMFVPFGFLLPCLSRKCRRPWVTYAAGAGFTLLIELSQLIFHLGIFESDDILNNILGTVIGYGFYRLCSYIAALFRRDRNRRLGRALLFQLPLCVTAAAFGMIFLVYHFQELGNLRSAYGKVSMKNVDVRLDTELSEEPGNAQIYQIHIASREETLKAASDFFAAIGDQVNMSRNDYYDNTAIYWSEEKQYSLWIDYAGTTMEFYNHNAAWDGGEKVPEKEDADREEIEKALSDYGVSVVEGAVFENAGEGSYWFTAEQVMDGDTIYNGTLHCIYHVNGQISNIDNRIVVWEKYKEARIKTEREAYEELLTGRFRRNMEGTELSPMVIRGVTPAYERDSKGYYQPVYVFDVLCNQEDAKIVIPALR